MTIVDKPKMKSFCNGGNCHVMIKGHEFKNHMSWIF
jgi:hypothetical protein